MPYSKRWGKDTLSFLHNMIRNIDIITSWKKLLLASFLLEVLKQVAISSHQCSAICRHSSLKLYKNFHLKLIYICIQLNLMSYLYHLMSYLYHFLLLLNLNHDVLSESPAIRGPAVSRLIIPIHKLSILCCRSMNVGEYEQLKLKKDVSPLSSILFHYCS